MIATALTALIGAAAMPVAASPFTNGSFEIVTGGSNPAPGTFTELGAGNTDITGWLVSSGNIDLVNTSFLPPDFVASNGQNSIDLNGNTPGAISQTFDTVIGQLYHVTFDLNINPYGGDGSGLHTLTASAGAFSGLFGYPDALHPAGAGGPWLNDQFDFLATGASTTLSFQSNTANCCWGPELDNVAVAAVTASVPEPLTISLFATGLGGMTLLRRRKRVRSA